MHYIIYINCVSELLVQPPLCDDMAHDFQLWKVPAMQF